MATRQDKKSFLVYHDSEPLIRKLTKEQAGELFLMLFEYSKTGKAETNDTILSIIMSSFSAQLDRDYEKWLVICERNSKNRNKKKKPTTRHQWSPVVTTGTDRDRDSDSDIDSDYYLATVRSDATVKSVDAAQSEEAEYPF